MVLRAWASLGTDIAHASGMVCAQADCSPDEALTLMEARAAATGRSLEDIADAVIERRIRLGG
jgi:AmiR/NasT family two-component response regulator